jgi:hypothetical protein
MKFFVTALLLITVYQNAMAAFGNFNSVLIGEQAAGMGGAYTAMSGDSSSSGFYNPASLVKLNGSDISASATLFNKFDTTYGDSSQFLQAGERVNRGFFRTIPSALGNVYRWKKWAFGISIVVPDYDFFAGNIADSVNAQSFLNYTDESLWSGFVSSYKASSNESFGISLYYTARSLIRSTLDRSIVSPTHEIITSEEKSIKHNGVLMVLGYLLDINSKWSFGASIRTPALNISGQGSYYLSLTDTDNLPSQTIIYKNIKASTYIPPRYSLGLTYKPNEKIILSVDGSYYSGYGYRDMSVFEASDLIEHKDTWNASLGFEYHFQNPNFNWRVGAFTNNSSFAKPSDTPTDHVGEQMNLLGFSSNINFLVSEHSRYTIGGFYTGGSGFSAQKTGNQFVTLNKNHHIFSLLISTSYQF